jgi:hypothetical protein
MTRLFPLLHPILVATDGDNVPVSFEWQDKRHIIHSIANVWRVEKEWWHIPIARDYFLVATHTGLLVEIFRDRINHEWYMQRLYD